MTKTKYDRALDGLAPMFADIASSLSNLTTNQLNDYIDSRGVFIMALTKRLVEYDHSQGVAGYNRLKYLDIPKVVKCAEIARAELSRRT